ncbi:probable RNA-directed DNA polymerase from transposon X-element [Trichonephila inaurata madagascariensis]|uniref:Probable RNA-directed DNA polymerase from transposon X-element n=1 Tax=Trichonephila inaurata madagascariensis TaxID=2747483 RepID=A0A8X7C9B4_9ARAC|nr:probable RNA-directed DNA polymerase from transposon X-element [Trichonephila inaurata madagascariensis]
MPKKSSKQTPTPRGLKFGEERIQEKGKGLQRQPGKKQTPQPTPEEINPPRAPSTSAGNIPATSYPQRASGNLPPTLKTSGPPNSWMRGLKTIHQDLQIRQVPRRQVLGNYRPAQSKNLMFPRNRRTRPLKIVSWNADSIINKVNEFEIFISEHDPDIIALQETKLRPCHSLNLPNYKTYRTDRLTHRGGGTAILIKRSIPHHILDIKTHSIENTTISIEGDRNITVSSVYRPPRSPAQSLISDLLKIFRNRPECIAVGDYNAKHSSWNHHPRPNPAGTALHKFARNCGFVITAPGEPTLISNRRNGADSTIDFGVSCGLSNIQAQSVLDLSSDHNPVIFTFTPNSPYVYAHNCCTFTNWERFQDILSVTVPGNPKISDEDGIERAVENLTHLIQNSINQSSKIKFMTHQAFTIPSQTRQKIKEKNRLRKIWQETRYPPVKTELNRMQREIKRELQNIKNHAWDCDLEDANDDPNAFYKIMSRKRHRQIIYPPLLGYRGLIYDTREKADFFADTLEESFKENKTPYSNTQIDLVNRTVRSYLRNTPISLPSLTSPGEVCEIILDLKNKKAPGKDNVKNLALKSLPINAITYLTKVFNRCLAHNYFPKAWKHAIITVLPKPGKDDKLAINYRPISLLSTMGKIFEKIVLKRIQKFTQDNSIIPNFQHGFQEKTSTSHQLLRISNNIITGFNKGRVFS